MIEEEVSEAEDADGLALLTTQMDNFSETEYLSVSGGHVSDV